MTVVRRFGRFGQNQMTDLGWNGAYDGAFVGKPVPHAIMSENAKCHQPPLT